MAIFGKIYDPVNVSVSMDTSEGTLTQEYNVDTSEYVPDRRVRPAAIQPVVRVSDPAGLVENGVVNSMLTDIKWYEGELTEDNAILDTNGNYKVDRKSENDNRGRLTVYKNVAQNAPLTLHFTATYVDMINGKVRRKADVFGMVVLSTTTAASAPLVLATDYPRGKCLNPIQGLGHLKLTADLMAGDEVVPAAFWWYRKDGSSLSEIKDWTGARTRELQVPAGDIGNVSKYVVKVQDCRQDLTVVQDEWLETELEKIRDYPRNLIAKQYMMDWNELRAGITEKGRDEHGEFWGISGELLYLNTSNGKNDVFGGKINFQAGVRYKLTIVSRPSEIYNNTALIFAFKYKDGTFNRLDLNYQSQGPLEQSIVSEEGKDLERITATYGISGVQRIYDIQLTEVFQENLIEDSEEIKTRADGVAVLYTLGSKKSYSLRFEKSITTSGESDGRGAIIYDNTAKKIVSNPVEGIQDGDVVVLIPTSVFIAENDNKIYLYAHNLKNDAQATFEKVMLVEGEYTRETMPAYCPKWIPNSEDLAVESREQGLPEGYRPSQQVVTDEAEYTLVRRMPRYGVKVVTPWGDDRGGVIMIPPKTKLFPAWLQVDLANGTLESPEKYFSADWGNGKKGMQVLLDASEIETGLQEVNPTIYEDLREARYGVCGATGKSNLLEDFEIGTRIVIEAVHTDASAGYSIVIARNNKGVATLMDSKQNTNVFVLSGLNRVEGSKRNNKIFRLDITLNDNLDNTGVKFNDVEMSLPTKTELTSAYGSSLRIYERSCLLLLEIYSPDGTLLHKWDMEGETQEERLSDKAETGNKINLTPATGFELKPI